MNTSIRLVTTFASLAVSCVLCAIGKEDDAVAIGRQIVPRLDHPLD